ncbi:MAG: hypothetical protein AAF215_18790 [Cyanobacteria bacterium P01_A01_bin.123]
MQNSMFNPQPQNQFSATETESTNILGPVVFKLSNLLVAGQAGLPALPTQIAPGQSPYIVSTQERIQISVDIAFNDTPLTQLLLCLGTRLKVRFSLEGIGGQATEVDLEVSETTRQGIANYTLTFEGTPESAGLTPGLYAIAAVVSIGPVDHACAQDVFGYGYIVGQLLQVYAA